MNVAIRYFSKGGNTQKIAEAIAQTAGCPAKPVSDPISAPCDLLFLGGALYAGNINKDLRAFAEALKPNMVKKVAVFSNAANPNKSIHPILKEILHQNGVEVADQFFHCQSKFLLAFRGHPDAQDLAKAQTFAKSMLK